MDAISAVMLGLLSAGDHVLFVNQTYGPTLQLAAHLERFGVAHDLLLDVSVAAVEAAIRPSTKLIYLESPGTMLFRMLDVPAIAAGESHRILLHVQRHALALPREFEKPVVSAGQFRCVAGRRRGRSQRAA